MMVWDLEPAGNWATFTTNGVAETRAHNIFNEITSIDSNSLAVLHDRAGNMTRFPNVFTNTQSVLATWDAWNRLTRLADTSDVTIAVYSYDGDWKRLKKTVGSAVTEYYYDDMQLAEVRTNGVASEQIVYDTRYLHSVALRDRDTDGDGDCTDSGGSERLFYCNDANFNVTALVATNGTVVERYTYDPYGKVTIRDANWQPITWDASQKNIALYTGHKYDAESGLYYSIYRYYHPGLGRWASRDPIITIKDNKTLRTLALAGMTILHPIIDDAYIKYLLRHDPLYLLCRSNPIGSVDSFGLDDQHELTIRNKIEKFKDLEKKCLCGKIMSTAWLDAKASSGRDDNPSGPPTFSVPAHKLGMLVQYDYQVTDTDVEPCCKCCSWRQWYKDGKNKKGEDKWTEEKYCDSRGRPEGCVNRKCNCDTANEIWACNIADFPGPESETQRGDPFKSLVPYEQEFKSEVYLGTVHIGTVEWGYAITERHGEFDYTAKGKIKITCRDYSKK